MKSYGSKRDIGCLCCQIGKTKNEGKTPKKREGQKAKKGILSDWTGNTALKSFRKAVRKAKRQK